MFTRLRNAFIDRFVNNVRQGFATNSSSSHSLVFMKDATSNHDNSDQKFLPTVEFGWQLFKLTTLREKLFYALVQIVQHQHDWMEVPSKEDVEESYRSYGHLFPELSKEDFAHALQGYVDHDSATNGEDLLEFVRDPRYIILGGNDNEPMITQLPEGAVKAKRVAYGKEFVDVETLRNDKTGEYFI